MSFTSTGTGVTTSPQNVISNGSRVLLSNLKAGTYSNFSITVSGCTATFATSTTLTDPAAPTLTAGTAVNPTTFGGTNGSIPFTTTNLPDGTYSLSFTATGVGATTSPQNVTVSSNAFTLTGLKAGTYSNFSVTVNSCTGSVATSRTLTDPPLPTLTAGAVTNAATCGANGSIAFTTTNVPNGTYSLSFTPSGTVNATTSPQNVTVTNNAFTLTVKPATYNDFSLTVGGQIASTGTLNPAKIVSNPAPLFQPSLLVTHPTTCGGSNGSIPFTALGTGIPDGTYSLSFTPTGTGATTSPQNVTVSSNAFSLTGLTAGTYSNFNMTVLGCSVSASFQRTLNDPNPPTLTAGTSVNPTTCGGTNGSIPFTTTNLSNGTYSLSFTATGAGATTSPKNVTVSSNAFTLSGLKAGTYSSFSLTSANCTGTTAASRTLSNPITPTLTAGNEVNPTTCGGTDGLIPFTTNLADGTYSLSYTGTGSPKSITVSSGTFTLGGLGSGGYSNFSITNNGCTGTSNTPKSLSDPAAPVLTLGTTSNPTACNLSDGSISFTTTNITDGTYSLTYTATGTGATVGPKNVTVSGNAFTLTGLGDGTYSSFSITNGSGCTGSLATAVTLVDLALPVLIVGNESNTTSCGGTDGTIAFTTANLPDGTYSLSFSTTGTASPQNITVASNAFILSGLLAGTYSNFSVTRLGCTGTVATSKTIFDPNAPTLTAGTPSNPTTCNGMEGSIPFTTTNLPNGTYSLSFTTTGTSSPQNVVVTNNTFTLTGLRAGNYSNFSLTNAGCTGSDATLKTLNNPLSPSITAGLATNPSTCSAADGKIAFTSSNLPDGSYTMTYTGAGSPKTVSVTSNAFDLTGLDDGTYSNFAITYLGCTATSAVSKTVSNPAPPTLTAGTPTNPTTCASTDGSIPFTTSLPNGNYTLNYTGFGSPKSITVTGGAFTLTGLPDGTFSNFSITSSGCTSTDASSKTLSDPAPPTLTAGTPVNPTTCLSTDGSIPFTTSLPNGTYSLSYTGSGSPQNITVTNGAFTLGNLPDGTFSGFSVTVGGCTGVNNVTKTLNDPAPPTLTAGMSVNPTTCLSSDGTIAFTTSLPNGTYTLNYTGSGSPQNITVTSGAFTLGNLPDGTFSGFSVTTGGCTGIATGSKTLTDPNPPTLTAGTPTNPSTCLGSNGSIPFTTSLANGIYTLNYTGSGSPQNVTVNNGAFTLGNLPSGTYNGFSVTVGGCTGIDNTSKSLNDPTPPTAIATGATVCEGASINLTGGPASQSDYAWTGPNSYTSSSQSPTINNATTAMAGVYTLTVTGTNACTASATANVVVNPNPTASATGATVCTGASLSIAASGGTSYSWSGPNSFSSGIQNPTISTSATSVMAGVYTVTVSNTTGCTASATANVVVNPNPTASATGATVCTGASLSIVASGGTSYSWSGPNSFISGIQNPTISTSATSVMAGTYTVRVTGGTGCTATALAAVVVNPVTPAPTAQASTQITAGNSITLTATGCSGTLKWYESTGNTLVTMPVSPNVNTSYYAKCEVTANGITCASAKSADVLVVVVPAVTVVYVNATNTNPTQDGTTWTKAFSKLQDGLVAAGAITGTSVEVWVAKGTYKPTTTTDRTLLFNVPTGVKMYGGFVGTETSLNQRNFRTNETLLSGDIGVTGVMTDNSYHILKISNGDAQTLVDGFSIKYGYAANQPPVSSISSLDPLAPPTPPVLPENGGGVYIQGGNPTISNCVIQWNNGIFGAGVYAESSSTATIQYCTITANVATFGGGIYNLNSNTNIHNTLIANNKALGAGLYNNNSSPVITNVTIANNGGSIGVYNTPNAGIVSVPVIKNSIIWESPIGPNPSGNITYSLVQGGYIGVGNINLNPQFIAPQPATNSPIAIGDYHVKSGSPSTDTGDNGSITLTDTDLDGNLRRYNGGKVDMGAYEYQGVATSAIVMSIKTGNWEDPTTWNVGRVPIATDNVIIDQNHTITVTSNTATAKNLEYRLNSRLNFSTTLSKLTLNL